MCGVDYTDYVPGKEPFSVGSRTSTRGERYGTVASIRSSRVVDECLELYVGRDVICEYHPVLDIVETVEREPNPRRVAIAVQEVPVVLI